MPHINYRSIDTFCARTPRVPSYILSLRGCGRMPVSNHSNLVVAIVDMCMAVLRDPENGLRLQKRSEIWASDERPVSPLRKFVCDG